MITTVEIFAALGEGQKATRESWESYIYLHGNTLIRQRNDIPFVLGQPQGISFEFDWEDLTAKDWRLVEPTSNHQQMQP
jgi:hypothetical protein